MKNQLKYQQVLQSDAPFTFSYPVMNTFYAKFNS